MRTFLCTEDLLTETRTSVVFNGRKPFMVLLICISYRVLSEVIQVLYIEKSFFNGESGEKIFSGLQ